MNQQTPSKISDGTIRRFLLAQLSAGEQLVFEAALFTNSQLEQRVRLSEIELIDDYAAGRLRAKQLAVFHEKFLVTAQRQKTLEVSNALRRNIIGQTVSEAAPSSVRPLFNWPRLGWRVAFALVALIVLFASALVIRREPQLVKRIIPKRLRPAAVKTPTPQATHHPANSPESPTHRDESPSLPAHEAAPQIIVLRPGVTAEAPVFTHTRDSSNVVGLELTLERTESATFSIAVKSSSGEVVHNVPEIHVEHADRIDFDVQVERLKAGHYQVILTRISGDPGLVATYYFRVP